MKNKNETDTLNDALILLQNKRAHELTLLKAQWHTTYESLKPINLIKSSFLKASSSLEVKNNVFSNALSLGIGFLTKKILVGNSHNPFKRLIGTILQFAVANVVSKHSDSINSTGVNLVQRFLKYRKESKKEFHGNGNSTFLQNNLKN
jgi:hypothetical protein